MRHRVLLYNKLRAVLKDENGATMVEYSLMVAFIAIVAFAAVALLGSGVAASFSTCAGLFP